MNKKTDENFTVPDQTIKPVDIEQFERLIEAESKASNDYAANPSTGACKVHYDAEFELDCFLSDTAPALIAEIKALRKMQKFLVRKAEESNDKYVLLHIRFTKLAEAVETERAILAARAEPDSQHVAVALRKALTAYREERDDAE